jgi:hypothetical protein
MGSKLGFILSLLFLVQLFAMVGDLMSIQFIYTNLDAVSVTAGYLISTKGQITNEVIELVKNEANATIEQIGDSPALLGSTFEYRISKPYNAMIINQKAIEIAVVRSVVIGYYN